MATFVIQPGVTASVTVPAGNAIATLSNAIYNVSALTFFNNEPSNVVPLLSNGTGGYTSSVFNNQTIIYVAATSQPVFYNVGTSPAVADPVSGIFSGNVTIGGLLYESLTTAVTAGTTRTQAGATALTKEISYVTVATAPANGSTLGDGVALPVPLQGGLDVTVVNVTQFPIQVYTNTGDAGGATINGILGSTGVAIPPGDVANFETAGGGLWYFEAGMGSSGALPVALAAENITAVNPVSQATAYVISAVVNHFTNVNAAGAAAALPQAIYGLEVAIENATANPLTIYPRNGGTDAINGLAANSPILIPGYTTAVLRASSNGVWQSDPFFNGVGAIPSTGTVQIGSAATGGARSGGNVSVQVNATGQGNGADTTDDVLATYALPASALDVAGRQVTITIAGKFAATANNKRVKIFWGTTTQTLGLAVAGGTLIADSGVVTTNGGGFSGSVQVTKYGAAGSNTQIGAGAQIVAGATHTGTQVPTLLTAAENGVINITVTGSSSTTGAANDVVGQMLDVAFNN